MAPHINRMAIPILGLFTQILVLTFQESIVKEFLCQQNLFLV